MSGPQKIYQQQVVKNKEELRQLEKKKSLFGWLRLLSMGLAMVCLWWLWTNGMLILLPLPFLFIAMFLFILSKDLNNNDAIENLQRIIQINETETEVLNHHFTHLPDGSQYNPESHAYASDLDIFGRASLYQYLNRCCSEQGNRLFADWLLHPFSPETILSRQKAVKELSSDFNWRQQLQSYGMANPVSISTQHKIDNWLKEPNAFSEKIYWRVLKYVLPAISFTLLILHITGIFSSPVFYPSLLLMLGISFIISKQVMSYYYQLDKAAPQLESLSASIKWTEEKAFDDELLNQLKNKLKAGSGTSSQSIKKLKLILDRFDVRLNPLVFIPLNTFLFWDLQQIFALEKWKTENKASIDEWFHTLAEFECLSSLANFHFNHPGNTFPVLTGKEGFFSVDELGHPLIQKEKLVCNSFSTEGLNQINLITGSNMAGKSTFLRSVGVNIVLAMTGSSVHAKSLILSPMKVLTSMRVSDSLEESTSTFYAELKKLKDVIETVYKNEKVFLLLDEILRGTNSADRHTGSKALLKQLVQHNAAGLVATHDLELAKLADEFPANIHNYHFDVQVANDELYFDYKLKRGVCQSMNASLLMKKIGIEL